MTWKKLGNTIKHLTGTDLLIEMLQLPTRGNKSVLKKSTGYGFKLISSCYWGIKRSFILFCSLCEYLPFVTMC